MKLKNPQAKGKRQEYFVRNRLREAGFTADRNPMSGAISWLKGDIRTSLPFFVEVKNTEKTQFAEWYHKAETESHGKPPLIIWTRNNEDTFCFLRLDDFLSVITNKPIMSIKKPEKPKKAGLEETRELAFSKYKQTHKNEN